MLDIPADQIVRKGRLQPGKMFLVDTAQGRIIEDDEVKAELAAEQPYQAWLDQGIIELDALPERPHVRYPHGDVVRRQLTFGYTIEDQKILGRADGAHRRRGPGVHGHRHADRSCPSAPACRSTTSPSVCAGHQPAARRHPRGDGHQPRRDHRARAEPPGPGPAPCRQIQLPFLILDNDQLAKLMHVEDTVDDFRAVGLGPLPGVRR